MMAAAVDQQRAATQEIAGNVSRAASGTQEVAASMTGVNRASETVGTAADDLRGVAHRLADQAAKLDRAMVALMAHEKAA